MLISVRHSFTSSTTGISTLILLYVRAHTSFFLFCRSNNNYWVELEAGYGVLNFDSKQIKTDYQADSDRLPSVCEYVVTGEK